MYVHDLYMYQCQKSLVKHGHPLVHRHPFMMRCFLYPLRHLRVNVRFNAVLEIDDLNLAMACMIHRENGGTLGMVPLMINPIYTLYSGYLLGISPFKGLPLNKVFFFGLPFGVRNHFRLGSK